MEAGGSATLIRGLVLTIRSLGVSTQRRPLVPADAQAWLWGNVVRHSGSSARLRHAVNCERGDQATMQKFEHAFMLGNDQGKAFVFYDNGSWEIY